MSYSGGRTVEEIARGSDFCEEERGAMKAKLPAAASRRRDVRSRRAGEKTAGRK